ncbi:MAG: glucose-6-phosphate isomerase [Eubacteriales bacterium]
MSIKMNLENFQPFFSAEATTAMIGRVETAHKTLYSKSGPGNDFLGWLDLPEKAMALAADIKATAEKIKNESEVLVVVGIGGSYLGARSAIEFMNSPNYNLKDRKGWPQIFFAGNNLSSDHTTELMELIGDRDFSVNVISKSGGTVEPALAFHFFETALKAKYGDDWTKRVYVTTDAVRGDLRGFANKEGCISYVVDDDIGGRFSVLSAVGLLPIACAGIDIDEILAGAYAMQKELADFSPENPAVQYACARNLAYEDGKPVEILGCYEPRFRFMGEWWKQLFGESEGKNLKGIFPASVDLTADLHSMGQYIQDGQRILFETMVDIANTDHVCKIENTDSTFSRLALFEGMELNHVNQMARQGTAKAHVGGGVPNMVVCLEDCSPATYGAMVYFFEVTCGLSAYTLGVNPFDQPGVEDYKREMIKLVEG